MVVRLSNEQDVTNRSFIHPRSMYGKPSATDHYVDEVVIIIVVFERPDIGI